MEFFKDYKIVSLSDVENILPVIDWFEKELSSVPNAFFSKDFPSTIPFKKTSKGHSFYLLYNKKDIVASFGLFFNPFPYHRFLNKFNIDTENTGLLSFSLVSKKYRGRGIQRESIAFREDILRKNGVSKVIGTSNPKNYYSIKNFERAGYYILKKDIIIFDSPERDIYIKNL